MLKQVYVHVENKPGRVYAVMKTLADANVNARALSVADDGDNGIIRLIADDAEKAETALKKSNFTVKVTDLIAFAVPDKPGELCEVMRRLGARGINIKYLYSLMGGKDDCANIVIRVSGGEYSEAESVLTEMGVRLIGLEDIL